MTNLTININNLYKENTTQRAEFDLMVKDWSNFKKHSISHVRKSWARFARYFVQLESDLKEVGYNVQQTADFIDKYFPNMLSKTNRSWKGHLRYFAKNTQECIDHANKIGSTSVNPSRLAQLHMSKVKAEREKNLPTEEVKKTDKQSDKVINRVQGAKHLQREVEPARQGKSTPMTCKDVIGNVARSMNHAVQFNSSMGLQKKHINELKRLTVNFMNYLETCEHKPTEDKTPTNTDQQIEHVLNKTMSNMLKAV